MGRPSKASEAGRLLQARRKIRRNAGVVLRNCEFCGAAFGAREMRRHRPVCPARKRTR